MGQAKRELERHEGLVDLARGIAIEAGAIEECPMHSDVLVTTDDDDANKQAYAIATNRWKAGGIEGTRRELTDAVKEAIESADDECPRCEALGDA